MLAKGDNLMITISLCMIVKNEEQVLSRCLDSLAGLMDEIIIVDTGSCDRTREIAAAIPIKSMTISGRMTLQMPEILLFPKLPWNTFIPQMQMKS